jgi:hypothetical protein
MDFQNNQLDKREFKKSKETSKFWGSMFGLCYKLPWYCS